MKKEDTQHHSRCLGQRFATMCPTCQKAVRGARQEITDTVVRALQAVPRFFANRDRVGILVCRATDSEDAVVFLSQLAGLDFPARAVFEVVQEVLEAQLLLQRLARAGLAGEDALVDWRVVGRPTADEVADARAWLRQQFGPDLIERLEQALGPFVMYGMVGPRLGSAASREFETSADNSGE